jgi:hypothetical protein
MLRTSTCISRRRRREIYRQRGTRTYAFCILINYYSVFPVYIVFTHPPFYIFVTHSVHIVHGNPITHITRVKDAKKFVSVAACTHSAIMHL